MSLELYKQVNEELTQAVQEQKIRIGCLEAEVIKVNSNFFNEHQRRIEERQHFLQVIYKLKSALVSTFDRVIYEVQANGCVEDSEEEPIRSSNVQQRLSLAEVRRRSSGVTVRSPLKPMSSQQNCPSTVTNEINPNAENESPLSDEIINETVILENITELDDGDTIGKSPCINNQEENNCDSTKNSIKDIRVLPGAILREQNITPSATSVPTITLTSSNLENITLNFNEQLCLHSTPRRTVEPTKNNETASTSTSSLECDTLSSSRPSRRCKPTLLTEPSLTGKLRNAGQTKKPQKKKRTQI